jgi:hypothetical protein
MKALDRLESFIREIVERPAALLGGRRLHPMEIAAAITRALETGALPLVDRVLVPDVYTVRLSPEDHALFAGARRSLEREFAEYVHRLALERGLTLAAPASVTIEQSATVRPGAVDVQTRYTDDAAAAAAPVPAARRTIPAQAHTELIAPTRDGTAPRKRSAEGAAGTWTLEVLAEDGTVVRRQPLAASGIVIGRNAAAGLALADPEVSRQHARIDFLAPRYYLQDLGSTNGTLVNGRKVNGRHPLADGDTINVGRSRLRVRRGE